MKQTLIAWAVFVSLALPVAIAGPRDEQWKKVEEAKSKGLPKSAVEALEPIITAAMKEGAYAEAIKAIGLKIALEGNIQGNKPEEKITRMQAEIAKAPDEMKPVMEAILANWYWHYFLQNRWRFMQRTQTATAPGNDFTTWDLPRILGEIDKQFTKALAHENKLKATSVAAFSDLLIKGTTPDSYRPTLFDFLAFNALDFYSAGEQAGAKAEDDFVLTAVSPIFTATDAFLKWQPATTDTDSPTLKAIRLYQNLLAFHRNDADKSAFIDADLWRLDFGRNKAFGEEKNTRYKDALKLLVDDWAKSEISARALAEWAGTVNGEGDPLDAWQLARRGYDAFPKSIGGAMCFNLIQQIEAKSVGITTERVWNEPLPDIRVNYRNISKILFRAVAWDFDEHIKTQRWGWGNLDEAQRKRLLAAKPDLEWAADLPPTKDYKERHEKLPAPKNLKPGFYYLIASGDPGFGQDNNQVSFAPVWVSDLALIVRTRQCEGIVDGFVLNAISGVPIAGAVVRGWSRNNEGWLVPVEPVKSDDNGLFRFTPPEQRGFLVLAESGGQRLAASQETWVNRCEIEPRPFDQTVFFTDRSLYRPGQTIQFKGICLRVDQAGNKYETLAGQALTVLFTDPNNKEIARLQVKANDYGSFSGSFTAPRDRVTGRMQLMVHGGPLGSTQFNVEEYKRPKFQVELTAPKIAPKLDSEVVMPGHATAYTGASIGGAKVKWRVVREVRYPHWCWWSRWYFWPGREQGQAIAHGTSVTENDGGFTVKFVAKPDPSAREKDEPTFEFTVFADVTDTTGETRSSQHAVRVGFTALQATLSAGDWLTPAKPVEIAISTTTLDGEPQAAAGSVKIYALKQPAKVQRAELDYGFQPWRFAGLAEKAGGPPVKPDPSDPNTWELGAVVSEQAFKTDATGATKLSVAMPAGIYRAMLDTKDRFGKAVTARMQLQVVDPAAKQFGVKIANHFAAPAWTLEPGEKLAALWGTGYDTGRAFVEVELHGKLLRSFWTAADRTQEIIEQEVGEEMRGGFTVRVTFVRENRAYLNERVVEVPWTNKQLALKWEHFTSKLGPAQKETWTATVTGPDAKRAAAEMVAGLYDASLDAYQPHDWLHQFNVFRHEQPRVNAQFVNHAQPFQQIFYGWRTEAHDATLTYRSFPNDIAGNFWGYNYFGMRGRGMQQMEQLRKGGMDRDGAFGEEKASNGFAMDAAAAPAAAMAGNAAGEGGENRRMAADKQMKRQDAGGGAGATAEPDLSKVSGRKNLNETAFFFPHLLTDATGVVKMEFTMPEALTEWKFLGFAHDKELRSGYLTNKVVTVKDLMVEPNPPRFVREGDVIEFTVKVSNQTATRQTGKVRLTLADARTLKSTDDALGNKKPDLAFDIPSKESRSFSWRLSVPDGLDFLTYKAVGATDRLSDGEEGYLPVLSRRILVIESLPLPIRGAQTKKFDFTKLRESNKSATLRSENLTVQMVSQPAWYAVMALPYLMEYPHECTEATFNRLYANALARYIAKSDPKIRRIFDLWKGTPALDSPLEKNQDLKSVMLEETPWLKQAQDESQARKNVGILFDENRLNEETARLLKKLAEQQMGDGAWPWFPGGPPNEYITLYITTGFGRMRHLGVDIDVAPAIKSLARLDNWINDIYREILKHDHKDDNHLSSTIALYLYGRSFFLKDKPVDGAPREAVDYFLGQAKKYWLALDCRQSQAHLAIALQRFGDKETATAIMKSMKERSVSSEELGMFWRDLELSWWWFRAPIETQALMVEAFDEVMNDAQAVEDCKVWLLKQKQTQDWKTTKATADAVYALMLRGTNLLASDELVEVSVGGQTIKPEHVEAGTGFYEKKFVRGEIKPAFGNITVKKTDAGVSWGSVHWQYLEDMTKVTPYEGTPLKLKKSIYVKDTTKKGQVLKPVTGPIAVGDELVVRIELRVDRDMEYVHLKDQRGSGTEPVNVLSRYKFQDGLAYYENTKDTATNFFIDYLPKGVYVFEYSTRVQLKGDYQTGIASIQCLYAPEFNSHSESFDLKVK